MEADLLPRRAGLTPEKITREHQQRLAIIYIRQSTPQQIERNQESTKLQYALVDRAFHFGWARETIVTIDDDLGRSGSTVEGRLGFQRLVAEVGLGHVGLVLGIEMSRLARSCRDWHQLLEICALFDTLIADVDGVYDPANYNDRLLLGLKGTMSEAELHILQARMLSGRNAKARRGELGKPLPMGYLRRPSGEVALDPDEQAQSVIRLVFDLFDRLRTVSGVLRYLVENDIKMPVRLRGGLRKDELEWRRPSRPSLGDLFGNPLLMPASTSMGPARSTGAVISPATRVADDDRRARRMPRFFCPIACQPTSPGSSSSAIRNRSSPIGRANGVQHAPAPRCSPD
jgi:DNA invertase Pin-like site-specific DNA recombinase